MRQFLAFLLVVLSALVVVGCEASETTTVKSDSGDKGTYAQSIDKSKAVADEATAKVRADDAEAEK